MSDLVSVVTPAYNAAEFIAEAIDSVRRQDHRPLEHVVVDDCSPDGLADLVQDEIDRSPAEDGYRLRLVRQPVNSGTPAALQAGIDNSTGDYVAWLSADDLYAESSKTREQLALLDRFPRAAMAFDTQTRVGPDPNDAPTVYAQWPETPRKNSRLRRFAPGATTMGLLWKNPINGTSVLMRRGSLEQSGGFDPAVGKFDPDGDLWLRMNAMGLGAVPRASTGTFYRTHAGQQSQLREGHSRRVVIVRLRFLLALQQVGLLGEFLIRQNRTLAAFADEESLFGSLDSGPKRGSLIAAALLELAPASPPLRTRPTLKALSRRIDGVDLTVLPELLDEARELLETPAAGVLMRHLAAHGLPKK